MLSLKRIIAAVPGTRLPVLFALGLVLVAGAYLLYRADAQARDTIRKHHLADLERSLFFARDTHGTYPPYDQPTWCGQLSDPKNAAVKAQVETELRAQNEQYKNVLKPFPIDPRFGGTAKDYFYWKHSPASFELYSILEAAPTGDRNTAGCTNSPHVTYDYGLNSVLREDSLLVEP